MIFKKFFDHNKIKKLKKNEQDPKQVIRLIINIQFTIKQRQNSLLHKNVEFTQRSKQTSTFK